MDANLRIEITTAKTMDVRDDPHVRLRIEDKASGEVLVATEITAGQWLALTTGTTLSFPGFVSSNLHRVGRTMAVRSLDVPREVAGGRDAEDAAKIWADRQATPDEQVEVRNTNRGWQAIFRSWP